MTTLTAERPPLSAGAQMFANRLRKNLKELTRWAKREQIDCYRLYDADMPEYAVAIDLYHNEHRWVYVQEYEAPKTVAEARAQERLREVMSAIPQVLEVDGDHLFLKVRRRQKGSAQYEKQDAQAQFQIVPEGGSRFYVNFHDYLDTGLFLDHRITRSLAGQWARNQDFLNLFAYTGSATVYAARYGATSTTTVDMSNTYLNWAQRNMALNGFTGGNHRYVQADCVEWLEREARLRNAQQYGVIFLDPPTFSTSKRMESTFDVQRDHVTLIRHACQLLTDDGVLIFSNNFRKFRLDQEALAGLVMEDMTQATIPHDFARNPKIHHCWKMSLA
ncbi:MAG: 23S rRNA (guanine2445-N2)-methyltransferase [Halothiobacillaceae bacterium]|nr:MAG: 23S rRNA (guanine2445-N2)-methyltransferase [Halothiobacillaceae bacterium]